MVSASRSLLTAGPDPTRLRDAVVSLASELREHHGPAEFPLEEAEPDQAGDGLQFLEIDVLPIRDHEGIPIQVRVEVYHATAGGPCGRTENAQFKVRQLHSPARGKEHGTREW